MNIFYFGAFQKIIKILSHDKILFHMLFGAFHDTPCKNKASASVKNRPSFIQNSTCVRLHLP